MAPFSLIAVLMCLVAFAGWANVMTLKLPHGVAMLLAGLAGAVVVYALQLIAPQWHVLPEIGNIVGGIDFAQTVTGYMLAFLLFAGAMQVDLAEFRKRWASITALAVLGVIGCVVVVGFGLYAIARAIGVNLPLPWALVFGALISPTDAVAVLSTVRHVRMSKPLTALIQGEALFNDGVGIVAFTAMLTVATGAATFDPMGAMGAVFIEALGALILGVAASAIVIRFMGTLDDFSVEVSMTIALAMSSFAGAEALGLSGPIAAAGAGVLFGGQRAKKAMEGETEVYLKSFWTLIDEILNALLFLLLGVEVIAVPFYTHEIGLIAGAIPLVLLARFAVVLPWGRYYKRRHQAHGANLILGWGGLHGAVSMALALSLPETPERAIILAVTYAVVAFSITVQGLSFAPLVRKLSARE
jgi:CPA1 family monovalent cation:H+ antiporter